MEPNAVDQSASDVSRTVEYSMDKWLIEQVPWALWGGVTGLTIALHLESRGVNGAVVAVVYLILLGLAGAGFALTTQIGRSGISSFLELPIHLLIYIVVAFIIAVFVAAIGGTLGTRYGQYSSSLRWSALVDPPPHVFGWMLIYLGLGWITFALYRHVYPARPIVMLSPAGIAFHRPWLPNLFIPWQDVYGVGPLDISDTHGPGATNPQWTVVVVGKDFYEHHIAPKRSFFEPPGTDYMFRAKGEFVQMTLNSTEVAVGPEDYRVPVEARWRAFRDQSRSSAPEASGRLGPNIVYGRWSIDGTASQVVKFLAPLAALVAVVLHASVFR
jgi:hypothetical protein